MKLIRSQSPGLLLPFTLGTLFFFCLFALALPRPLFSTSYSPMVLDRQGVLLSAVLADDGQWRLPPSRKLNPKLVAALVNFEDKRFFRHTGVDFLALARATKDNMKAGEVVSGGSTLTMQLIRLARSGDTQKARPDRNLWEKAVEAFLGLRAEVSLSKEEILDLYSAHAPFGGNVVGVEAASWRYFGRSPDNLSWAEACTLAVLPNSPGLIHPGKNRDTLKKKRDALLSHLAVQGYLTAEDLGLAQAEPLPDSPKDIPQLAPHLLQKLAKDEDFTPGRIRTTVDRNLQKQAQTVLLRGLRRMEGNGIGNAACLIIEVDTGEVLAYVGNVVLPGNEVTKGVFNDMVQARRSTGSLLKPFLYAGMLDAGIISPQSLLPDLPTRIGGFMPENISKTYSGAVTAQEALARSLNVPAARNLRAFGIDRFLSLLKELGMTTLFRSAEDYGLPLILGGAEGKLWELTGMYAGLVRRSLQEDPATGAFFPPVATRDFPVPHRRQTALSPGAAWLTLKALQDVHRPPEEAGWESFSSSQRISWKTGTSNGFKDAWAIGVNGRYAVGVWAGNADGEGRPNLMGILSAAPLLFDLFNLLPASRDIPPPEGAFKTVDICPQSGYAVSPDCPDSVAIRLPKGAPAVAPCPYHRTVHLSNDEKYQVSSDFYPVSDMKHEKWFILPPGMEWYYRRSHAGYRPLPPWPEGKSPPTSNELTILQPEEGQDIYIPIELDGRPGKMVAQAADAHQSEILYWHLDQSFLGSTQEIHQWELRPSLGKHVLTVMDSQGHRISRSFNILSPK